MLQKRPQILILEVKKRQNTVNTFLFPLHAGRKLHFVIVLQQSQRIHCFVVLCDQFHLQLPRIYERAFKSLYSDGMPNYGKSFHEIKLGVAEKKAFEKIFLHEDILLVLEGYD